VPGSLINEFWNGTPASYASQYGQSIPTSLTNFNAVPYFDVSLPVSQDTYYFFVLKSASTGLAITWDDLASGATPTGAWWTNNNLNGVGPRGRTAPADTGVWDNSFSYLGGNMQMEIQVVPEPATVPLAGLGLAAVAWVCRRARRWSGLTG
jgi:hypothetical protein